MSRKRKMPQIINRPLKNTRCPTIPNFWSEAMLNYVENKEITEAADRYAGLPIHWICISPFANRR